MNIQGLMLRDSPSHRTSGSELAMSTTEGNEPLAGPDDEDDIELDKDGSSLLIRKHFMLTKVHNAVKTTLPKIYNGERTGPLDTTVQSIEILIGQIAGAPST
ncbi:hypothetical protein CYMTET_52987 [Cymbomonas tetramitiformis]|uniref:Uncharacterized protein n=1 Tax=Cymbomonas tetramitiformis TaxID=36881 RepID=A0AAE0BJM9_9CHLO|nr:hypothetical protein CYMTET_52987 [Cymbomonas tetramitiformis]